MGFIFAWGLFSQRKQKPKKKRKLHHTNISMFTVTAMQVLRSHVVSIILSFAYRYLKDVARQLILNTVEPALKTTWFKRPPVYKDHFNFLPMFFPLK